MQESLAKKTLEPSDVTPDSTQAPRVKVSSRREIMTGLATLGGLLGLASESEAQSVSTDPVIRLVQRCTYGATQQDVADARYLTFNGWLNQQLTMTDSEDQVCEAEVLRRWPRVFKNSEQLYGLENDWITVTDLQDATFYRMIYSKRQLYQRMCEFWRYHLNIFAWKVGGWMLVDDTNKVIRKHALGKFPEMLFASAHSGAMMQYLDNASSVGGAENQNYARELMELHSMGVNGGYTQQDVINVARCLTGFSFQWDPNANNTGSWLFYDWAHDNGTKKVLGRNIAAGGGVNDGNFVVRLLAVQASTARFISRKLIRWFLGEGNFTALETAVTNKYVQTAGDIKEMLKLILTPANLTAATPKLKRPAHLYASTMRQMKANMIGLDWTRWGYINQGGHELYGWAPPNGYPDANDYWSGLMLPRWNFYLVLLAGWMDQQIKFDLKRIISTATTPQAIADRIEAVFFVGKMPVAEKTKLVQFLNTNPTDPWRQRSAIALALCSPSYQWM